MARTTSDATDAGSAGDGDLAWLAGGAIRQRVLEYLGGDNLADVTCVHLARCDAHRPSQLERWPVTDLDRLLAAGSSVGRSLYDTRSILVHLDIEYVNHDDPTQAFTNPERAFALQQPVVRVIQEQLTGWGVRPLHLLTGQGHHFVWRFARDSELHRRLERLIPNAECGDGEQVFANLALVMEYLAHRIKAAADPLAALPVELTAMQVPPALSGQRELVSVDISEYGDPLDTRSIRVPFTRYLKPWRSGLAARHGIEQEIPPCITIPQFEMDVVQALQCRRDPRQVAALAERCPVTIPEGEHATNRLLDDYLRSPLRAFHHRFYEARHDPPERWSDTYARTPTDDLPGCVRHVLNHPNDLLLKPSSIRLVTRCLLARGWHPRHIAGLVRSKFEDPAFGWGDCWREYSPSFRADFYVRLVAGQLATGLDRMSDFNCPGQRATGFCWPGDPPCDLGPLHDALAQPAPPPPPGPDPNPFPHSQP